MNIRKELPRDQLLQLARRTLGHTSTSSVVPRGYLDELRKQTKFCKDDTLFLVVPHPGYGYGLVLCKEKGCEGVSIPLKPKTIGLDDGRMEGIGSLSAYRLHIEEHFSHKKNRFERVKAMNNKDLSSSQSASETSTPRPSNSLVPVNPPDLSQSRSLVSHSFNLSKGSTLPARNTPSAPATELKYYDTATSSSSPASSYSSKRKRGSPLKDEGDTDITMPSSNPSSPFTKKAKLEGVKPEPSLAPLATVNPNYPKPNPSAPQLASQANSVTRMRLVETMDAIAVTQRAFGHLVKKARKSAHDRRRIEVLVYELECLRIQAARYETALQQSNPNPVARTSIAYPVGGSQQSSSKGDYKPQPFAPVIESKPFVQPVASTLNIHPPAALPAASFFPKQFPDVDQHMSDAKLPNYGDAMDYGSDSYDSRYRRHVPYRGPIADPGDIEKFLVEAGNSEFFDGNESVDKALEKIGLKKLGQPLPHMTIALMPHQVIGVAWMKEHELGNHKGGILADEMGLGKTVQMIATMLEHRSDDPAVKSTLICAPVALLAQWKLEIETKTEGAFKCLIYHGSNKTKAKTELQKYDVVLTTFQTLALEYNDPRAEEKKKAQKKKKRADSSDDFIETDSDAVKKTKKKEKGLLLRISWFRIVLDEAQNIRNRNTRISIAVTNLDAKYRWCLTGTPVTNSLADCYGLIRFLQIRPWHDWQDFNKHICLVEKRRPDLATTRLQAILNSCLLRRKKDSVLDGKKLIELPPKKIVLRKLEFSSDERDVYNAIEAKSRATFNKFLRAGTVLKNYTQVLVLLLRLRQICSHPCLIQEDGYAFVRPGEDPAVKHEVQAELERATILAGAEFVKSMQAKLKTVALQRMAAEKASAEAAIEEEDCPICFDGLTKPILTRCGHVFCADCIDAVLNQPPVEDGNQPRYAMSERPCPSCREPVQKEMLFQRSAFEPTDSDLEDPSDSSPMIVDDSEEDGIPIDVDALPIAQKGRASLANKGKGKAKRRFSKRLLQSDDEYETDDSALGDFIVQDDEDEEEKEARRELKKAARNRRVVPDSEDDTEMEDEELLPPTAIAKKRAKANPRVERFLSSTKMKEMMVLLKSWAEAEESKDDKTMVLSQWTSCLDLVADYLHENGFTFVRFQGDMSRMARDEAVRTFMSQGKARIMLMSLKCGGVGLNLTRANRVISLDLGWSFAVESQAFDRVHRLGQAYPVTVQRLVIENTVEARILALQERKQNLADGSLGEGNGKKLGRLSVRDLANLFGLDAHGRLL